MPDQQSLLRLAKVQRFFTQGCPVMAGINRLLRMGVAFHHALVEGFATGRGQQELVLELINNKPGEGGEIDGVTAGRCDQTRRKFKAVMLGWGKISHSEMERLLFAQRDDQFGWLVFRQPPVFGFTNQGIQEALRSHIQG
ncbi:hypothetical protein MPUCK001_27640 [Citrobacter koseri]|nr:hypothetical protein MPUCK001_27640 [Citrobacter koseri]